MMRTVGPPPTVRPDALTTLRPPGPSNAGVAQVIRHALRALVRAPVFALVVVVTLALGIGANSAIFSVVNAVILRPLGYPEPGELVHISSQFPNQGFDQFWI